MGLLGRHAERAAVETLLADARAGRSGILVVRGEAGIGKSALLDFARETGASAGFRVESAIGVEAETQFAFAGLHQLCAPLLHDADQLPEPQLSAVGVALGQRSGPAPDPFLVGLATLTLLNDVAEKQPLLCLVDDVQWLDEASAHVLAFVARRVEAERIALVFGLRDSGEASATPFTGLPELSLGALSPAEARMLLTAAVPTPLDERVTERILAEARGNPLALLELPLSAQLAGGFDVPHAANMPRRIEDSFHRRSRNLPRESQQMLLLAAAEPTGDPALLARAADILGIPDGAAEPAETAGLLEIDTRVRFRHPLVRSAVYHAAAAPERRRAHSAIAAATDAEADPDRRAWHRARAALGPDDETAAELENSADRALARGGMAAAAAFLQQAAELSADPAQRARRALEAAHATYAAGSPEGALELVTVAVTGPLDALQHARVMLLRAHVAFYLTRGVAVPALLLAAADALAPLDAALSRETYLNALDAAVTLGGNDAVQIARAALGAPPAEIPPRPVDLLLDGLATTLTEGYAAGAPLLRQALDAFHRSALSDPEQEHDSQRSHWLRMSGRVAVMLLDDELTYWLASRNVELCRKVGALVTLPDVLRFFSITSTLVGELTRGEELAGEASTITEVTGGAQPHHAHLILSAWRGEHPDPEVLRAIADDDAATHSSGAEGALMHYALAVLHNGLGNYAAAREAAARSCASYELSLSSAALPLPELIEACVRVGEPDAATEAMAELDARARVSGTPWALGLAARSRALLTTGSGAEDLYRQAIGHLRQCRMVPHLARAHLLFGEWLRREGRRHDAREHLRTAHDLLSDMGAGAFAVRAARELSATGEHPRKRTAKPVDALTPHELHIARLVAAGATSREVGAQLFLSPRTIEAHLRNTYRKLGVTSRRQLREIPLP